MRDRGYRTPQIALIPSNFRMQNYGGMIAPSLQVAPIQGAKVVRVYPQANKLHSIPVSYMQSQISIRPYNRAGMATPIAGV